MTEQELFWRNQSEERERWLKERESELAALRQQLAEARAEVERLVEERERTINELHDAADELSCPHVHGIETVDGKAEAVWLGAMVAKQLRVNAERNGVERGEVAKLLEDNWRLYKQQLAAQAAELERLRKELDGAETYGAEMTRNWECVCKNNSGPFAQLLREVHERHFAELSTLQSESAAFEKLASDYQDVIARLDGDIDRLREAAEELVNMVGGNCSWQEVFTVIDGRLRAALTTKQEQGK